MKKIKVVLPLIAICVLSLTVAFYPAESLYAESIEQTESQTLKYIKELSEKFPDRTAGTSACDAAAEYLIDFFDGLDSFLPYKSATGAMPFTFKDPNDQNSALLKTQNIAFIKKSTDNPDGKSVIIGAHYDNSAKVNSIAGGFIGGEGVSNNATGVAVFLSLAKNMQYLELDFDVIFTAFSAEEYGFLGSGEFFNSMSDTQKSSVLLYVNLERIGSGDFLYAYAGETDTLHLDFIFNVAKANKISLNRVPKNARLLAIEDGLSGLAYTHYAMSGAHARFFKEGINMVSFESANYSDTDYFLLRESNEHPNIVGTADDTLAKYMEYYGENGAAVGDGLTRLLLAVLTDRGFVSNANESRARGRAEPLYNDLLLMYAVYFVILSGATAGAYIVYKKLTKNIDKDKPKSEPKVKSEDIVVYDDFGI